MNGGRLPQGESGFLVIVDLVGKPEQWELRDVQLAGIADLYPEDAEPEYVDINAQNIAVVTFQENNHLALIDLASGAIINHFSAGYVDLFDIDTQEEKPALITLTGEQLHRAREPDGVTWLTEQWFVTADEGDLDGGSRGITVFDKNGHVVYSAGNQLEHEAVRTGHYPDGRSNNHGNEPENVEVGRYGNDTFLFVASERSSVVFVYKVSADGRSFELRQTLPAGLGPEGLKAIPQRKLLVAASENDARAEGYRSVLNIYQLQAKPPAYPTLISADRADGSPIPWGPCPD
nr:hypothetical protein [Methylomarinum sp. Ch1-1]MDP4520573.1 hypothetical protein [Methylomarinum sp. Ch1-1]